MIYPRDPFPMRFARSLLLAAGMFMTASSEKAGACLILDGANDADYRNHALQFQGSLLWIKIAIPDSTNIGYASAVRVNEYFALTAGHIIYSSTTGTTNVITHVGTGTNYETDPGIVRAVSKIMVYPGYFGNNWSIPDIAIIRFDQPIPGTNITFGSPSNGEVLTSAGFGRLATPSTGMLPQDGRSRAWDAPVEDGSLVFLGFSDEFYFGLAFSPTIGVPMNGKGLSGDSGGPAFNASGELVAISVAQTGNGGPLGRTISLRLHTVTNWIAQNTIVPPTLLSHAEGTNLVLSWSGSFLLQSSTNVAGSYVDLPVATSPYTNAMTADPQRFFRLRSDSQPAPAPFIPAQAAPKVKAPREQEVEPL